MAKPAPIVTLYDTGDEPVTNTGIIATVLERRHSYIMKLVRDHLSDLGKYGAVQVQMRLLPNAGKRKVEVALLNEYQFGYLLMQMRQTKTDSDKVKAARHEFVQAFRKMRRMLKRAGLMHKDLEWQTPRQGLKAATPLRSAAVRNYVNYAVAQGSERYRSAPEWAYINITRAVYKRVVEIDPSVKDYHSLRELMLPAQLIFLAQAEHVVDTALRDGMRRSVHYKGVYAHAMQRLDMWAEVMGVEPTPLPDADTDASPALLR